MTSSYLNEYQISVNCLYGKVTNTRHESNSIQRVTAKIVLMYEVLDMNKGDMLSSEDYEDRMIDKLHFP